MSDAGKMSSRLFESSRLYLWATVVFAIAITLAGASQKRVSPVDASMRASMARTIVETGKLFPPYYDGEALLDHPPGYIWSIAASFKVFGVNDFAAQLPGRLSAFLSLLLTWLIARRIGLGELAAFFSVLVLGTTRDFILIAMQGGIEPLLNLWSWLGFYFVLPGNGQSRLTSDGKALLRTGLAAACVVLAAFSKGPPAAWPLLFFVVVLFSYGENLRGRFFHGVVFFIALAVAALPWIWYILAAGDLWYWKWYWQDQVLGSALRGRNMQQGFEPLYFIKVLAKDYWPWLPLLLISVGLEAKTLFRWALPGAGFLALLFAGGFFAGFSIVKWKFWYYIAPAFPGFALFIAFAMERQILFSRIAQKLRLEKTVLVVSGLWILVISIFPISLSSSRLSELQVFKETMRNSPAAMPVWFVNHPADHNMYATSGNWYFNRIVRKVTDTANWEKNLRGPAWIITGAEEFKSCKKDWCVNTAFTQSAGSSTLIYLAGSWKRQN